VRGAKRSMREEKQKKNSCVDVTMSACVCVFCLCVCFVYNIPNFNGDSSFFHDFDVESNCGCNGFLRFEWSIITEIITESGFTSIFKSNENDFKFTTPKQIQKLGENETHTSERQQQRKNGTEKKAKRRRARRGKRKVAVMRNIAGHNHIRVA